MSSMKGSRDAYDFDEGFAPAQRSRSGRKVIVDDGYESGYGYADAGGSEGGYGDEDIDLSGAQDDGRFGPSKRTRRRESYGDAPGAEARAVVPHGAAAQKRASRDLASNSARSGGGVWMWAIFAMALWVGGVLGFSIGLNGIPADSFGSITSGFMSLPNRIVLMIAAVAIAPIGFIVLSALTARRAQRLLAAADRMSLAADEGGRGVSTGAAPSGDVDGRLDALERQLADARAESKQNADALTAKVAELSGRSKDLAADMADIVVKRIGSVVAASAPLAQPSSPTVADPTSLSAPPPRRAAPEPTTPPPPPAATRSSQPTNEAIARATAAITSRGGLGGISDDAPRRAEPAAAHADALGDGDPFGDEDLYDDSPLDDEFGDYDSPEGAGGAPLDDQPPAPEGEPRAAGGDIDWSKFVIAANFPDSEDDRETLDALYAVLTDPEAAALLQSAEDALSALADIELYMEDMQPHHAPAERWRSYIVEGDRTDAIDLGGIRDAHAIEDVANSLESDSNFVAAAEKFMDRYEAMLERLFAEAPSAKLAVELADTRSGRAYMLLARAAGRFG